jgi:PEP-CTERM motif
MICFGIIIAYELTMTIRSILTGIAFRRDPLKKLIYLGLLLILFTGISNAATTKWTIQDRYIGGGYFPEYAQKKGNNYADVISGYNHINDFDIDKMVVTISDDGSVSVKIKTDYKPDIGGFGTDYGDLFISTNGWGPLGKKSSRNDTYLNGQNWDYVFDTDSTNSNDFSNLYEVVDENIILTDDIPTNEHETWYRHDQEVQYTPGDTLSSGEGSFSISNNSKFLIYAFDLSSLGISLEDGYDLGFRWSMSCGNDIIEGGGITKAAVPEPGTLTLLGIGLMGLCAAGRKKRFTPS